MENFATLSEACNYAVMKIVEQGERCMLNKLCAYFGPNGNRCAAGWLFREDAQRDLDVNSGTIDQVLDQHPDAGWLPPVLLNLEDLDRDALSALQSFHDSSSQSGRDAYRSVLRGQHDIETSGDHWQQWIDMGEPHVG